MRGLTCARSLALRLTALCLLVANACASPSATGATSPTAAVLAAPSVAPAVVSTSPAPPAPRVVTDPYSCTERLEVPNIADVTSVAWSPDGATLAVAHTVTLPGRYTGTPEDFYILTLDLRSGQLRGIGLGERPLWSGSGRYVAYYDYDENLRIAVGDKVIASPHSTIPDVRWEGDTLFYFEDDAIRAWSNGDTWTVAQLPEGIALNYPRDDAYFSADAQRFTLSRYRPDGTVWRFLGTTRDGSLTPLDAGEPTYMEWSPVGQTLLLRYTDRIALRSADGAISSSPVAAFPGPVHAWAPGGGSLLMGPVSAAVPGKITFDSVAAWGPQPAARTGALPNLLGVRAFSPNGEFFAGVSRTGSTSRLEVFRCGAKPDVAPLAIDAKVELLGDGRLVRPVVGAITQLFRPSHTGIDLAAPYGSLIVAADRGVVSVVGPHPIGGRRVCVAHPSGLESCYYHTSAALVSVGQQVARGQPIALVGMTGVTTGPHLHWEVDLAGKLIDPLTR